MENQKNKTTTLIIVAFIAIILIGGVVFGIAKNNDNSGKEVVIKEQPKIKENVMIEDSTKKDDSTAKPTESVIKESETIETEKRAGIYADYEENKLADAKDGKVVLFFKASWCPTCQSLDADINENFENIPQNISILKVDYDHSTELKRKYGVTYQHTFVQVDENGNQIKKWSASPTLDDILKEI